MILSLNFLRDYLELEKDIDVKNFRTRKRYRCKKCSRSNDKSRK